MRAAFLKFAKTPVIWHLMMGSLYLAADGSVAGRKSCIATDDACLAMSEQEAFQLLRHASGAVIISPGKHSVSMVPRDIYRKCAY
jgi:hypothetical protein